MTSLKLSELKLSEHHSATDWRLNSALNLNGLEVDSHDERTKTLARTARRL